jgi:hypothetical protein
MAAFSALSAARLATCDQRLQDILNEAIKAVDITIICGHRGQEEQDEAVRLKRSTLSWPRSKHNSLPSLAVDIAPYPVDWKDTARFARLYGYLERIAHEKGVRLRWGGDFNSNWRTNDEKFIDMPHVEIIL